MLLNKLYFVNLSIGQVKPEKNLFMAILACVNSVWHTMPTLQYFACHAFYSIPCRHAIVCQTNLTVPCYAYYAVLYLLCHTVPTMSYDTYYVY